VHNSDKLFKLRNIRTIAQVYVCGVSKILSNQLAEKLKIMNKGENENRRDQWNLLLKIVYHLNAEFKISNRD